MAGGKWKLPQRCPWVYSLVPRLVNPVLTLGCLFYSIIWQVVFMCQSFNHSQENVREGREAAWENGEGVAFLTQEWVIWMMSNPNCTKCTGKGIGLPKTWDVFTVFSSGLFPSLSERKQCNQNMNFFQEHINKENFLVQVQILWSYI
jgi:hypothetical protein